MDKKILIFNNSIYCFVTSFLQLLLLCTEVIQYFNTNDDLNDTENFINEIIKNIYEICFIQNWNHWDGENHHSK